MIIFKHELRQNKLSLIIWTLSIAFLLLVCVFIYPLIEDMMEELTEAMKNMEDFSKAFQYDQLAFTDFTNYFASECASIMGLAGALYSGILAISILSKEEKDHTADFLLVTPITRRRIMTEKLLASITLVFILNFVVYILSILSIEVMNFDYDILVISELFLSYFILHITICCICFLFSSILKGTKASFAIAIGIVMIFYFIDMVANMIDQTKFLKYFTPFNICETGYIIENKSLNIYYLLVCVLLSVVSIILSYIKYPKKDIM